MDKSSRCKATFWSTLITCHLSLRAWTTFLRVYSRAAPDRGTRHTAGSPDNNHQQAWSRRTPVGTGRVTQQVVAVTNSSLLGGADAAAAAGAGFAIGGRDRGAHSGCAVTGGQRLHHQT